MEAKVGGETKHLIHIIYFLTHSGVRVEQPRLFLARHNVSCGVRLRDMKGWLEDLRGKDMPDAFAWSYKRRYKNGYIWQDLVNDEDLIVPISDGEYILQGSAKGIPNSSSIGKKIVTFRADSCSTDHSKRPVTSPTRQRHPYASTQRREHKSLLKMAGFESEIPKMSIKKDLTSFAVEVSNSKRIREKIKKIKSKSDGDRNRNRDRDHDQTASSSSSSSKSMFTAAGKASGMFRNFIRCRAIETKDAALVAFRRAEQPRTKTFSKSKHCIPNVVGLDVDEPASAHHPASSWIQQQLRRRQIDSRKSFDDMKNRMGESKRQRQRSSQNLVSAAYKPVSKPKCSQCGKSFRPEKMHRHMKSCRGLKTMKREGANTPSDEQISSDFHDDDLPRSPDFNRQKQNVQHVSELS